MKLRTIIIVQVALLLSVIVFGGILSGDLGSQVRALHRVAASLSIIAAIISVFLVFKYRYSTKLKLLSMVSLASILLAGFFGSQTPGADNYFLMLNLMRVGGGVALATSVSMFVIQNKENSK